MIIEFEVLFGKEISLLSVYIIAVASKIALSITQETCLLLLAPRATFWV